MCAITSLESRKVQSREEGKGRISETRLSHFLFGPRRRTGRTWLSQYVSVRLGSTRLPQTLSTFSLSTELMVIIVLMFLLSVSVSLFARLESDTPMCNSECIGRIPAFASSIAFLNCKIENWLISYTQIAETRTLSFIRIYDNWP